MKLKSVLLLVLATSLLLVSVSSFAGEITEAFSDTEIKLTAGEKDHAVPIHTIWIRPSSTDRYFSNRKILPEMWQLYPVGQEGTFPTGFYFSLWFNHMPAPMGRVTTLGPGNVMYNGELYVGVRYILVGGWTVPGCNTFDLFDIECIAYRSQIHSHSDAIYNEHEIMHRSPQFTVSFNRVPDPDEGPDMFHQEGDVGPKSGALKSLTATKSWDSIKSLYK